MKNVFFDLDGTLIDPREGIVKSICYALQKMEFDPPPESDLEQCIGPPLAENFATLFGSSDPQRIGEAVTWYRERFARTGMFENILYPGVPELLGQLQSHHHNLENYFSGVYGSGLDGTRAQKDQLIHYVLKQERIAVNTAVMVGDRRHDINGALANDVVTIGVTYGYGSKQELIAAGANWLCDTPQEIFEAIISL